MCECGQPAKRGCPCSRCAWLDVGGSKGLLVEALRDHRWLTAEQLVQAVKFSKRHVVRLMNELLRDGRVKFEIVESNVGQVRGYNHWAGRRTDNMFDCKVWSLVG